MNMTKRFLGAVVLASCFALSSAASAGETAKPASEPAKPAADAAKPAEPPPPAPGQYSEKGADTCLTCHNEGWPYPIFPIFKTKHAQRADARAPFGPGGLQCEACHGPGAAHAASGDKTLIRNFGRKSAQSAQEQNQVCMNCHRGKARIGWIASTHESNNVVCANCHKIHADRDPVLVKARQPDVCFTCHKKERADFNKPSTHPVRFGRIACSDCHSPHGSNTTAMLAKPSVNQTCYTCHAEKRGPFLWEHAPAAEDCTLCHTPHGSVYQALLKKNPPLLCQQCHSVNGHPAVGYTPAGLPGGSVAPSGFLLAGGCTNCHSQVHGSNHPSGVKLMR